MKQSFLLSLIFTSCFSYETFFVTKENPLFSYPKALQEAIDTKKISYKIQEELKTSGWMIRRIRCDIEDYQPLEYSPTYLTEQFYHIYEQEKNCCLLIEIRNNEILAHSSRALASIASYSREAIVLTAIHYLAEHFPIPDVTFLVSIHDMFQSAYQTYDSTFNRVPICSFAKRVGQRALMIPDMEALYGYHPFNESAKPSIQQRIEEGIKQFPWEKKKEILFWRGASTGGYYRASTWQFFPRSQIVLESLKHPEEIDARFYVLCQADARATVEMEKKGCLGNVVSMENSLAYKYLIDIDGNTSTFSRLYWTLLSNSLVFKLDSACIQWYYDLLIPWQHYIPVSADYSDLFSLLSWVKSHDKEAKFIAEKGRALVSKELTIESNLAYLYLLILHLAHIQMASEK